MTYIFHNEVEIGTNPGLFCKFSLNKHLHSLVKEELRSGTVVYFNKVIIKNTFMSMYTDAFFYQRTMGKNCNTFSCFTLLDVYTTINHEKSVNVGTYCCVAK